tara:strand:- start:196982 stop:197608 length:627 start_codon:yes stop_codon:yes gene_type:complete
VTNKPPHRLKREILSKEDVARRASDFLDQHHSELTIPIPIEDIAEFKLEVAILPAIALDSVSGDGIDAYLSPDMQEIHIDQYTYHHRAHRRTFSVAHEIGHLILHPETYSELVEGLNLGQFREAILNLHKQDLDFIEWQANQFAGLILVPSSVLKIQFENVCKTSSIDFANPVSGTDLETIVQELVPLFEVSSDVLRIRCVSDGLAEI